MSCSNDYCVGGGCVPSSTDVQAYVEAFGFTYNANDPLESEYQAVLASLPSQLKTYPGWIALAEACLRTRCLLFCTSKPGDAGTTHSSVGISNILGVSAQLGTQTANIAEQIAGIAGGAVGAVTAGIGSVVSIVLQAFQHHAAAVVAQDNALSQLCPAFSEAVYKIDQEVLSGGLDATDAFNGIAQLALSLKQADASLTKTCNAFCGYNSIAEGIAVISQYYYVLPAAAPSTETADTTQVVATGQTELIAPTTLIPTSPATATPVSGNVPIIVWVALAIVAFLFMVMK